MLVCNAGYGMHAEAGTVTMTGAWHIPRTKSTYQWEERPILAFIVLIKSQLLNEIWLFDPTKHRRLIRI
jgi:hypothetical protein